jgi:acyl transferase domain-containing protein
MVGILDNKYIDNFDCLFFNSSPCETINIAPQQRLLLEATWHCIEDAGLPLETLRKKIASVYTGFMGLPSGSSCTRSHYGKLRVSGKLLRSPEIESSTLADCAVTVLHWMQHAREKLLAQL